MLLMVYNYINYPNCMLTGVTLGEKYCVFVISNKNIA